MFRSPQGSALDGRDARGRAARDSRPASTSSRSGAPAATCTGRAGTCASVPATSSSAAVPTRARRSSPSSAGTACSRTTTPARSSSCPSASQQPLGVTLGDQAEHRFGTRCREPRPRRRGSPTTRSASESHAGPDERRRRTHQPHLRRDRPGQRLHPVQRHPRHDARRHPRRSGSMPGRAVRHHPRRQRAHRDRAGGPGQADARPARGARARRRRGWCATARSREIAVEEVVLDDLLELRTGDQVPADGIVRVGRRARDRRVAAHR